MAAVSGRNMVDEPVDPGSTTTATIRNHMHGTNVKPSTVDDHPIGRIPHILPHERVFPIQIGGELFKLSGASLSSDAPSYFSQYFLCQIKSAEENGEDLNSAIKTLYIDRDPATFNDIALHLQGYHVTPRDGTHFVRLFADAQFYSLPKLISQLYEESIFISIGHREFQIPRDIFSDPGNTPNFFSLGFAAFFSRSDDLFPGLDREGLIRPPSIIPPNVPNRNADTFAELLRLLRGYQVRIRDECHRSELLRDARYFHFKGLEQKLVAHSISFNQARQRDEIALRLENIQKSGISVALNSNDGSSDDELGEDGGGWVRYARPYVDDKARELVLEIGGEATKIHLDSGGSRRAEFFNETKTRIARLFEVISTKLNLPPTTQPLGLLMATGGAGSQAASPGNTPLSEDLVRVSILPDSAVTLDGREYREDVTAAAAAVSGEDVYSLSPSQSNHNNNSNVNEDNPRKRKRIDGGDDGVWIVKKGLWRLRVQPTKGGKSAYTCVLEAVKIDAVSSELGRNRARDFL